MAEQENQGQVQFLLSDFNKTKRRRWKKQTNKRTSSPFGQKPNWIKTRSRERNKRTKERKHQNQRRHRENQKNNKQPNHRIQQIRKKRWNDDYRKNAKRLPTIKLCKKRRYRKNNWRGNEEKRDKNAKQRTSIRVRKE